MSDFESQREQELAEARAIQVGILPNGSVRTRDTTICYEFQPFYEVAGDFLDFFTLTDGVIGIYLGDVTGKGLPAAVGILPRPFHCSARPSLRERKRKPGIMDACLTLRLGSGRAEDDRPA